MNYFNFFNSRAGEKLLPVWNVALFGAKKAIKEHEVDIEIIKVVQICYTIGNMFARNEMNCDLRFYVTLVNGTAKVLQKQTDYALESTFGLYRDLQVSVRNIAEISSQEIARRITTDKRKPIALYAGGDHDITLEEMDDIISRAGENVVESASISMPEFDYTRQEQDLGSIGEGIHILLEPELGGRKRTRTPEPTIEDKKRKVAEEQMVAPQEIPLRSPLEEIAHVPQVEVVPEEIRQISPEVFEKEPITREVELRSRSPIERSFRTAGVMKRQRTQPLRINLTHEALMEKRVTFEEDILDLSTDFMFNLPSHEYFSKIHESLSQRRSSQGSNLSISMELPRRTVQPVMDFGEITEIISPVQKPSSSSSSLPEIGQILLQIPPEDIHAQQSESPLTRLPSPTSPCRTSISSDTDETRRIFILNSMRNWPDEAKKIRIEDVVKKPITRRSVASTFGTLLELQRDQKIRMVSKELLLVDYIERGLKFR